MNIDNLINIESDNNLLNDYRVELKNKKNNEFPTLTQLAARKIPQDSLNNLRNEATLYFNTVVTENMFSDITKDFCCQVKEKNILNNIFDYCYLWYISIKNNHTKCKVFFLKKILNSDCKEYNNHSRFSMNFKYDYFDDYDHNICFYKKRSYCVHNSHYLLDFCLDYLNIYIFIKVYFLLYWFKYIKNPILNVFMNRVNSNTRRLHYLDDNTYLNIILDHSDSNYIFNHIEILDKDYLNEDIKHNYLDYLQNI